YQSILRKCGVTLKTTYTEGTGDTSKFRAKAKIEATVAMILKTSIDAGAESSTTKKIEENYDEIEFNLELPDDVADLIKRTGNKKSIILENFHYLPEDIQRTFAFDLRSFQDLKVKFIILGVWKEANRLSQFNGELQDRILEIPVEPWLEEDFRKIIKKGEDILNIKFSTVITESIIDNAFKSVGVLQELLKLTCIESDVKNTQVTNKFLDEIDCYERALKIKTEEYSGRHLRNLEAIASINNSPIHAERPLPYFLHYYIVMQILDKGYVGFNSIGLSKEALLHGIKQVHHRKDDLKGPQLLAVLKGLSDSQANKGINPPFIAYDSNSKLLKVIDSTFYFFLKNADLEEVKMEIINPIECIGI
ncbi:hypothetical protein, partial [Yersinia enterocolitica]|uniref:hypothetical protein n=1 Tax=Yersinia enterocolitica TaxID=630 RepID=UPI0037D4D8A4